MMSYLLGEKTALEKISQYFDKENLCVTALTLADLGVSVDDSELIHRISNMFEVLEFDKRASLIAGEIYRTVSDKTRKNLRNLYNASIAISHDAFFLTKHRADYVEIPGLKLV